MFRPSQYEWVDVEKGYVSCATEPGILIQSSILLTCATTIIALQS